MTTNCLRQITEAACALYAVRQADVWDGEQLPMVVLARQQICAALCETGRFTKVEVADLMGFHLSTIKRMVKRHRRALQDDACYADTYLRLRGRA